MNIWEKLTVSMQKSEAWVNFANALQAVNDHTLEPIVQRMKALPNLYEMHEDDVAIHFKELGEIFTLGRAKVEDRPLLLQQRKDEIHFKGYMYPIEKTFMREFGDINVEWKELYAPIDIDTYPYPQTLSGMNEIDDPSQWFLTSRSIIEVPFLDVLKSYGSRYYGHEVFSQFAADLKRVVAPLVPTRIVFEGIEFVILSHTNMYRANTVQMIAELEGDVYRPEIEDVAINFYRGSTIQVNANLEGIVFNDNQE